MAAALHGTRRSRPASRRNPSKSQAAAAAAVIARVVDKTLHEKPTGATHWSIRSLAPAVGLSQSNVQRIWKAQGLN